MKSKFIIILFIIICIPIYKVEAKNLVVNNYKDLCFIDNKNNVDKLTIKNINLYSKLNIKDIKVKEIKFINCNFYTDIILSNNIEKIIIDNSYFDNYNFLSSLNKLNELTIKNSSNIDILNYKYAKTITVLRIINCPLNNLNGIQYLDNINYLDIEDSSLEDIYYLKYLKKLDTLILTSTYVKNLDAIKQLDIKRLSLSNSVNLESLDLITNFKNLELLYADNLEMISNKKILNYIKKNNIESDITKEDILLKEKVEKIYENINMDNIDIYKKIRNIVFYVVNNIKYDYRVDNDNKICIDYNLNGLKYALDGLGCCKNYASLTSALLSLANVNNYQVWNSNHIWNLIEIDNNFYWLDTTWIDKNENIDNSIYYMNQSDEFLDTHYTDILPISYKIK